MTTNDQIRQYIEEQKRRYKEQMQRNLELSEFPNEEFEELKLDTLITLDRKTLIGWTQAPLKIRAKGPGLLLFPAGSMVLLKLPEKKEMPPEAKETIEEMQASQEKLLDLVWEPGEQKQKALKGEGP